MANVRFVFGREMIDEQMWEAFKKMAKECGIETRDTYKPKKKGRRKDNESKPTKG